MNSEQNLDSVDNRTCFILNFLNIIARFEPQLRDGMTPRFPEKIQYIIGPNEAIMEIEKAVESVKGYREKNLHVFKTFIGPLVPESIRSKFEKFHLNETSVSYDSLINGLGNFFSVFALIGLEERIESVKENYRFIVLPYLEVKFRQKIKQAEKEKPFGWRIIRKFYQRNVDDLAPIVDNLINLVTLGWTFCPAIGEPEMETGFFNRFIFTCNGGFIDLGHFFNCAMVNYLYGHEQADKRAEATEIQQRKLREKKWLVRMRKRNYVRLLTNLLWGYATSADTIEDRGSDRLGMLLGEAMRTCEDNEKIIEYYMDLYPKLVRKKLQLFARRSKFSEIVEMVGMFIKNSFYTMRRSAVFDIVKYMTDFLEEYDAIDLRDRANNREDLIQSTVSFYTEQYFGDRWAEYGCREWCAVIPQDLWEQVVRGREKFRSLTLPIKIQLKDTGKLVDPYDGHPMA